MKDFKIQKTYKWRRSLDIEDIVIFGCGGTGSYVVPGIARIIATQEMLRKPSIKLIDGDKVEQKNLARQNFVSPDIGKNKAEVMAARYSAAFGLSISSTTDYLETVEDFTRVCGNTGRYNIIVTCVDNVKSRDLVRKLFAKRPCIWIDCGNEEESGQVVFSCNTGRFDPDYYIEDWDDFSLPNVFNLYPNLNEALKDDKFVSEMSCAELAESAPQFGFVNMTAATLALNYLYDVIMRNPIATHRVEFSIKNRFNFSNVTQDLMRDWKKEGLIETLSEFKE